VETSRLWARDVAKSEPAWVEALAGDLLRHNYSEPTWSSKRAAAMATQRSTSYGVTVVTDRTVPYHRIYPVAARDMFIRYALIGGHLNTHHHFFYENVNKLEDVSQYEEKARRRCIVVDEHTLFDFYDKRLLAKVTTGRYFESWWKKERQKNP